MDVEIFPAPKTAFVENSEIAHIYHPDFLCFLRGDLNDLECRAFLLEENMIDNTEPAPSISTKMELGYFKELVKKKMFYSGHSESLCAKETYDEMIELDIPYDKDVYEYVFNLPDWRCSDK